MSIIAKGTKSLRKQDVAEQKTIALGFKKLVFAHQANAGETGINITSLVAPPDMTSQGFVNPAISSLTKVNIYQNKNNLKIVSSLSGMLMPYLSYTVNSSTYIAFNGFTAAQDEVFTCYLDEVPTTSLSVVDGTPIIASGTLLAGQTDFNIGVPIEINKYATQQIGAVMVYVDRGLQYRKVGNVTGGDGDYIEIPVAGGLGSLIRFDASASDRFVTVVSNGVVAERPDGSMTAMIENVQGQIDQIIPTVAALAGVPETNFQISPNSIDLKQFGDKVLDLESTASDHESRIDTLESLPDPVLSNYSGAYTPGTAGQWYALTNNSILLPSAGVWCVSMGIQARNGGPNPQYTRVHALLGNVNGANSVVQPTTTLTGNWANVVSVVGPSDMVQDPPGASDAPDWDIGVYNVIFTTSGPATIFGNAYALMTTAANSRLYVSIWAWRMR
jgi:hypothetical protein